MTPKQSEAAAERIVTEAMTLPDSARRLIAVTLLRRVRKWPDPHDPKFLAYIEDAPEEEKEAALNAALDVGITQLEAGQCVEGTPAELMTRIDDMLGMKRDEP